MPSSSKIRVLFAWLDMGPYHVARMRALGARPNVELTVARLAPAGPQRQWSVTESDLGMPIHAVDEIPADLVEQQDALVLAGWYEKSLLALLKKASKNCARVVFSESCEHDRPRFLPREWIKGRRLRKFDGAIAAGDLARRYFIRLGMKPGDVFAVGNIADDAPFRQQADAKSSEADHAGAILYAGRLAPEKNLDALIRGYAIARRGGGEIPPLVLAGSGPEDATLRETARTEGVGDSVRFLGETKPEPLAELMATCGFFVLPSLCEPWGLVVNEAMHARRPVLASPTCGCLPELLRPGASWLLRGFNEGDIAEGLRRALADRDRWDEMGRLASEIAEQVVPEKYGVRVANALAKLVERRRTR